MTDGRVWVVCTCGWRGRRNKAGGVCGAEGCALIVTRPSTRLRREPGLIRERMLLYVRPSVREALSPAEGAQLLERIASNRNLVRALKRQGVDSLLIEPPAKRTKSKPKRKGKSSS